MANATRATIRALARIFSDQTNSLFPTDAECNTLIDAATHRVWRKLVRAGWRPAKDQVPITANGAFHYPVAANISTIAQVVRVDGTIRTPLVKLKPEDRPTFESMGTGPATNYDIYSGATTGDGSDSLQIEFFPRPTSGSYEVDIIEIFNGFSSDSDKWFGPESSDELIALQAAIQMLLKEGDDQMAKMRSEQYNELYAEVCEEAGWLDSQNQQTVRDTRAIHSRDHRDPAFDFQATEGWL